MDGKECYRLTKPVSKISGYAADANHYTTKPPRLVTKVM